MAVSDAAIGWGLVLSFASVTVAAVIVNAVVGNYEDSKGHAYGGASNSASVSVAGVAAAMVLPKQVSADPVADAVTGGTVATKTFTITNDSNIPNAYIISAVAISAGSVRSVAFTPTGSAPVVVTLGTTVSPTVPISQSITVTVAVSTVGATVGSNIAVTLTAATTASSINGPQSDTGKAWIFVAGGAAISGTAPVNTSIVSHASPALPVGVLVNGVPAVQAAPGETLTFSVPFTNIGDAPAIGVVVTDKVPPQLQAIAGSFLLQCTDHKTGKNVAPPPGTQLALNGNTATAMIPLLKPGIDVSFAFQAIPNSALAIGTTIQNPATITAQLLAQIAARPAVIFIGAMDIVYDGLSGSAHPVSGAAVTLADPASGVPAKLPAAGVSALNPSNTDPVSTLGSGAFGFLLPAGTSRETDYDLYVKAAGYLNRKIKVAVTLDPDGLPTTTLTALDGLPIATAGGFDLTAGPVAVTGVTGFFGNVPLFSPRTLELSLAVDRTVASAGDRLGYTLDYGPGNRPVPGTAELSVVLPPGVAYAHDTARLGALSGEPVAAGRTLRWPLKDVAEQRVLTFDAVVLPGVTEGGVIRTQAHLAIVISGASFGVDAEADVAIVGGALSARSILTGRVFADHAGNGRFEPGDLGLAGVRIFLEDGESVQTDRDGRFSFPAARPGMHVLHLDPITLPPGMHPYHGFAVNDPRSSLRLVHGIFDSGLMDDVNFAVSEGAGR